MCPSEQSEQDQLLAVVYDELRLIAAQHMQHERPDHTLQATDLVHEAFIRLSVDPVQNLQGKAHFCAIASRVIRRILIDHARKKNAAKRGSAIRRLPLSDAVCGPEGVDFDMLALDEALQELAVLNPRHHQVVELRYFGGLTLRETAELLQVSTKTISADWAAAQAWLQLRLRDSRNP